MTTFGGANNHGTIFKITTSGSFAVIKSFSEATTGKMPYGNLVQGNDGALYGMTYVGGAAEYGTVFKLTLPTNLFSIVKNLDYYTTGGYPYGSMTKASDGTLYGMISSGGSQGGGTIFKLSTAGAFSVLKNLEATTTGSNPGGSLTPGGTGIFYGTTTGGGNHGFGTVFKFTLPSSIAVLRHLNRATDGSSPNGSLYRDSDGSLYGMTNAGGGSAGSISNGGTIFKITSVGSFSVLVQLPDGGKGMAPQESLVQAADGNFYGTTAEGGTDGFGTVYKLCTSGSYTVLRSLTPANGANPKGSLVQGRDGNFYGTTYNEGSNSLGTIFRMTPAGVVTVLKNLDAASGKHPEGNLVQGIGSDTAFYGMTTRGGNNEQGTIFKITSKGEFTVLKHLDRTTTGGFPLGSLVHGTGGALYGMTSQGGTADGGTIFKISTAGIFNVIKHLSNTTGRQPYGSLIKGSDGAFYGMTSTGGTLQYGTIFKLTSDNIYTVLKNLDGTTTGGAPEGNLVQGTDGTLYGMTPEGGQYKGGTIFKYNLTTKIFTVLRHLNPTVDGGMPYGSLVIQKPAPVVNAQSLTTNEDVAKAITFTATGGGTPLTYAISTAPKNGTVSGTGATYTYKPKADFNGKDSFYVTATWGCQVSAPAKIIVTVSQVNDAPVLTTIGNKTVVRGTQLRFTATATDVDAGQTKTFSLITPPSGAAISATTGAFTWTPTTTGTFSVKVRVTDNGSPVLFDEETITVPDSAPALTIAAASATTVVEAEKSNRKSTLYPNPVSSRFTVALAETATELSVTIVDLKGAVVYTKKQSGSVNQLQMDASTLKPGTYLLQLQTKAGIEVLKFIKL
jgi:uncharacterized repeat protein (TIGR03803 family)